MNRDCCESTGWVKSMIAGAIGGLAGALAMNQFQAALGAVSESMAKKERQRKGEPEPPQQETSSGEDATVKTAEAISTTLLHHELTDKEKKWAGPLVHYSTGKVLGAFSGALVPRAPIGVGAGTAYGAAVWLAADEIAVPLLGLSGPPSETPLSGHAKALASHLVFGFVTYLVRRIVLS